MNKSSELLQLKTIKAKSTPVVTVGICVRDSEATIKEAIDSVLIQDFPHESMELIIVDGYSKDKTMAILRQILKNVDVKNKVFYESEGLGRARQIVVDNATGKYIVWVDGDMVIPRDFVRKQVEFMRQHPKVGIAKGKLALKSMNNVLGTLESFSRAAGKMVDYRSKRAYFKTLGTSGSIYRTQAIMQVGGFEKDLKGYCEDWGIEIKIRAAGWLLLTTDAEYLDYERHGLTWKTLWSRYWRRGYDTHYFLHKHSGLIKHYRMFPPAAFLAGFFHAKKLFALARQKAVFLLPVQYVFKMTAWYVGFMRGHLDSYEPRK